MNLDTDLEFHGDLRTSDVGSKQRGSFHRTSSSNGSSLRRRSLSFSHVVPQELSDDFESEVVSMAGDMGAHQSNRYSQSSTGSSKILPIPEDDSLFQMYGFWLDNEDEPNIISPVSPLPLEIISPLSDDAILLNGGKGRMEKSSHPDEDNQRELPQSLKNISCLAHLAVFGILGVFTRYLLEKLFGPDILGVTSDGSLLYLDLPPNLVGSFLMGWVVMLKAKIHRFSDLLYIGLSTGFLGSLTTFSGWNQKMLDLTVKDHWVFSILGFLIGILLARVFFTGGIDTAKGFNWILKRLNTSTRSGIRTSSNKWKVNNFNRDSFILAMFLLILVLLWTVSGVLVTRQLVDGNSNAYLWLACIVGPFGVWTRWYLARLNGRGLGKKGLMKWMPFGTLLANVSAACVMAALATLKKEVNSKRFETIAMGIQFGFLGCLSTVSTFMAEIDAMKRSTRPWRAYVYAMVTIVSSFILGTLIYSVPMWTRGSQ